MDATETALNEIKREVGLKEDASTAKLLEEVRTNRLDAARMTREIEESDEELHTAEQLMETYRHERDELKEQLDRADARSKRSSKEHSDTLERLGKALAEAREAKKERDGYKVYAEKYKEQRDELELQAQEIAKQKEWFASGLAYRDTAQKVASALGINTDATEQEIIDMINYRERFAETARKGFREIAGALGVPCPDPMTYDPLPLIAHAELLERWREGAEEDFNTLAEGICGVLKLNKGNEENLKPHKLVEAVQSLRNEMDSLHERCRDLESQLKQELKHKSLPTALLTSLCLPEDTPGPIAAQRAEEWRVDMAKFGNELGKAREEAIRYRKAIRELASLI